MADGVPPLPPEDQPDFGQSFLSEDGDVSGSGASSSQWGLYLDSAPAIVADNVLSETIKTDSDIPNYPQEQGAFASYNKVQLPFSGTVRFSTGGSLSDRSAMLSSIDSAKQSLTLYDVVMPEKTWQNANVKDYEVVRKDGVYGLLMVDVDVEEVRETGQQSFQLTPGQSPITQPQDPGQSTPQNGGSVQGQSVGGGTTVGAPVTDISQLIMTQPAGGGW